MARMARAPTLAPTLLAGAALACSPAPEPSPGTPPAPVQPEAGFDLERALGLERLASDTPLAVELGPASSYEGYTVRPLSFEPWPGFRSSAALWRPDGEGPFPGVLVLPGHFGEGKASGECQGVAHGLAARGVVALAVDMPGVEEWDSPGRQLHFEQGAHNRAAMHAAGASALGLQITLAQRGLDALLEQAPVDRVAATGASGGGVLAFYLALVDPRVRAVALASPVGIPRDGTSGGCFCDVLPGLPGPAPTLSAALQQPSLWLSELDRPAPDGLPANARWEVVEGPHSYTPAMAAIALPWLDEQLGHSPSDPASAAAALAQPPHTPGEALRSSTDQGAMTILELASSLGGPTAWSPRLDVDHGATATCTTDDPPVLAVGVGLPDLMALKDAGLAPCDVRLPPLETWEPQALTSGHALVDRPASALASLSAELGGAPIYAVGAWSVAAAASGVRWVGRAPPRSIGDIDPERDPAWVHLPGGWWGGLEPLYANAAATGDDPAALVEALTAP